MNAQEVWADQQRLKERMKQHDAHIEDCLFKMLSTPQGRTVIAWSVRGTHNLHNIDPRGRPYSDVAWDLGRQFDARKTIEVVRRSRRCSDLFDQALREYENDWCSDTTGG